MSFNMIIYYIFTAGNHSTYTIIYCLLSMGIHYSYLILKLMFKNSKTTSLSILSLHEELTLHYQNVGILIYHLIKHNYNVAHLKNTLKRIRFSTNMSLNGVGNTKLFRPEFRIPYQMFIPPWGAVIIWSLNLGIY